jgi:hypothetical protein
LSIPCHPELTSAEVEQIEAALRAALGDALGNPPRDAGGDSEAPPLLDPPQPAI